MLIYKILFLIIRIIVNIHVNYIRKKYYVNRNKQRINM